MKQFFLLSLLGAAALTSSAADYPINFPEGTKQAKTNPARCLDGVTFSPSALTAQYLSVNQIAGGDLYVDCTSKAFVFVAGKPVSVVYNTQGNWMNSYLYIDWGNDGQFNVNTDDEGAITDAKDLVSYSNYNDVNSAGQEAVDPVRGGQVGNTTLLPDFTCANAAGTYRARFIIDYNSVDPGGCATSPTIAERGGSIADAYVVVVEPFSNVNQLDITSDHGQIQASYNDLDGTVTLTCAPDEDFFLSKVDVRNSVTLPEGLELADKNVLNAIPYIAENNTVVIPAEALLPGAQVVAKFKSAAEVGGVKEYPTEMTGEKNPDEGILSLTVNDNILAVNAKTRHLFVDRAMNTPVGKAMRLTAAYSGPAKEFALYIDTEQKGEFSAPVATAETLAKMGDINAVKELNPGVYRARVVAKDDCEVDFLLNVHSEKAAYRPFALNGIILDGSGNPMGETFSVLENLPLTVKAVLPGFETDTVIVRHGQNLNGPEFIAGNRQWADEVLDITDGGKVVIPASIINGDIHVYALFGQQESSEWTKIWGDEFSGDAMDSNRWAPQTWRGSTWNRYLAQSEGRDYVNKFEDGFYNAFCIKNPDEIKNGTGADKGLDMISGHMITSGKFNMTYGYVECRAKTRKHSGNFPAFWLMPQGSSFSGDLSYLNKWPVNGEIDIWESINAQDAAHTTVHSGWTNYRSDLNWPAPKQGAPAKTRQNSANMDLWHVFALEWDAEGLYFYIDGTKVFTYPNMHYSEPDSQYYLEDVCWPFNKPFYVIVNQSVGNGSWAAKPDMEFEYLTQFDYVRAYQKKGGQYASQIKGNGDDPDFYTPATNDPFVNAAIDEVFAGEEFDANAPVVIYDLSGRRIDAPAASGVYIMTQGGRSRKIILNR